MMDKHDFNIKTLGIKKSHRCPHCGRTEKLLDIDRRIIADSIMENSAGMWALLHCGHCGWVDKIYPTRINGVDATRAECDKLFKEMKRYVEQEGEQ